jgi:hypothetical protein
VQQCLSCFCRLLLLLCMIPAPALFNLVATEVASAAACCCCNPHSPEPPCRTTLTQRQEFCDAGTLAKASASWQPSNEDDGQMLKRLVLLQDVAQGLR